MGDAPVDLAGSYPPSVYEMIGGRARTAAEVVAPMVLERVAAGSAVDYGCGTGDWLAALRDLGVRDVLGVDGPWADRGQLAIAPEELRVHDLSRPFDAGRAFDLAICLEVMGHVAPEREAAVLDTLAALAPVLLFSAPVPEQPGVGPGPFNNRWPEYWAKRFAERGMAWVDCLRPAVWDDPRVAWWYAQNIALVVREEALAELPRLRREHEARSGRPPLALVHPGMLAHVAAPRRPGVAEAARELLAAIGAAVRRRLSGR